MKDRFIPDYHWGYVKLISNYDNYMLDLLYKNVKIWIHYQIWKLNDYHYSHTYEKYIVFASKFLNSLNQDQFQIIILKLDYENGLEIAYFCKNVYSFW